MPGTRKTCPPLLALSLLLVGQASALAQGQDNGTIAVTLDASTAQMSEMSPTDVWRHVKITNNSSTPVVVENIWVGRVGDAVEQTMNHNPHWTLGPGEVFFPGDCLDDLGRHDANPDGYVLASTRKAAPAVAPCGCTFCDVAPPGTRFRASGVASVRGRPFTGDVPTPAEWKAAASNSSSRGPAIVVIPILADRAQRSRVRISPLVIRYSSR